MEGHSAVEFEVCMFCKNTKRSWTTALMSELIPVLCRVNTLIGVQETFTSQHSVPVLKIGSAISSYIHLRALFELAGPSSPLVPTYGYDPYPVSTLPRGQNFLGPSEPWVLYEYMSSSSWRPRGYMIYRPRARGRNKFPPARLRG